MKPAVHRILKESRYSSTFIVAFEVATENAKDAMKTDHVKPSRINKLRLSLLDSLTRAPIDCDALETLEALKRRLIACDDLWVHVAINMSDEGDFWLMLKEALSLPYVHIPPAERTVIALCALNQTPVEPGDNDFSRICYLVLEELHDPRADSKARRKAFRQKLIKNHFRWYARYLLSQKPGRDTLFESVRNGLPADADADADTIAKIVSSIAGLK